MQRSEPGITIHQFIQWAWANDVKFLSANFPSLWEWNRTYLKRLFWGFLRTAPTCDDTAWWGRFQGDQWPFWPKLYFLSSQEIICSEKVQNVGCIQWPAFSLWILRLTSAQQSSGVLTALSKAPVPTSSGREHSNIQHSKPEQPGSHMKACFLPFSVLQTY